MTPFEQCIWAAAYVAAREDELTVERAFRKADRVVKEVRIFIGLTGTTPGAGLGARPTDSAK